MAKSLCEMPACLALWINTELPRSQKWELGPGTLAGAGVQSRRGREAAKLYLSWLVDVLAFFSPPLSEGPQRHKVGYFYVCFSSIDPQTSQEKSSCKVRHANLVWTLFWRPFKWGLRIWTLRILARRTEWSGIYIFIRWQTVLERFRRGRRGEGIDFGSDQAPQRAHPEVLVGMNGRKTDLSVCMESTSIGVLGMETGPWSIFSPVLPPRISLPVYPQEFRIWL